MGNGGRLLAVLGAVALAVALFFVLRGGDDDGGGGGDTAAASATATTEDTTSVEDGTEADPTTSAPSPPPPPPGPREIRFNIPAAGPQGIQRVRIALNERVVLVIRSGVADHAHLHGYDLIADVGPQQPARISFRANVPGRFEIELEDRGEQFAELTVAP
jgi:hypothetical protein